MFFVGKGILSLGKGKELKYGDEVKDLTKEQEKVLLKKGIIATSLPKRIEVSDAVAKKLVKEQKESQLKLSKLEEENAALKEEIDALKLTKEVAEPETKVDGETK